MGFKKYRFLMAALLLLWMLVIFLFSAQNGDDSSNISGSFAATVISIFKPSFGDMSAAEKAALIESVMLPVRKLAHFTLYFVLGGIAACLFVTIKKHGIYFKSALSWGFCVLYAVSDEIHQYFVPGRACAFRDVLIDSAGALLAIIIFTLLVCSVTKLKKYKILE